MYEKLAKELESLQDPEKAAFAQHFFKTGKGQYGEGDLFLGIRVPQVRLITKNYYKGLKNSDIQKILDNKWHEVRLSGVVAMTYMYPKATEQNKKKLYEIYVRNIGKGINNWDIVDVSCAHIVGAYLFDKNRSPLYELANGDLWQKRVGIISTFYFLRKSEPTDTYRLAENLVYEQHDLLQKAVGWSIREMGKVDGQLLRQFLDKYAATMPRTALRYSLEKLSQKEKQHYMSLKNK